MTLVLVLVAAVVVVLVTRGTAVAGRAAAAPVPDLTATVVTSRCADADDGELIVGPDAVTARTGTTTSTACWSRRRSAGS